MTRSNLRPIERRVLQLHEAGHDAKAIGLMFRRSPDHIERIMQFANLPGRTGATSDDGPADLRAIERCVLAWRGRGAGHKEIAARFRRSPAFIRRVEGLALYKTSTRLLAADRP